MKEEEFFNELFQKADLQFSMEDMEEKILKKIAVQNYYKRKIQLYKLVLKIGFACLLGLCLLFIWVSRVADQEDYNNMLYMLFGPVFILCTLMIPFEVIQNRLLQKKE